MTVTETSSNKGKEAEGASSPTASSSKPGNPKRRSSSAQNNDEVHKQTFSIKDLAADYVTLYPFQASIERNIENVVLKPGRNEITITDLSTWADENSIKVEGKGDAIISDMTVDRVLRSSDEESDESDSSESESESDSEHSDTESESEDEVTKKLSDEIQDLEQQMADHREVLASSQVQLQAMEKFGATLGETNKPEGASSSTDDMEKFVNLYDKQRARLYEMHKESQSKLRTLQKDLDKKRKQKTKLGRAQLKTKQKKLKERQKKNVKKWNKQTEKSRRRLEKVDEKNRKKQMRARLRPTHSFQVKILIEGSRQEEEASLKMSYIVRNASWVPHYDLRLDSVSKTGQIIYRAEFKNETWENWRDAKITLSTSATTFRGIFDTVPTLQSWNVKLGKSNAFGAANDATRGLYSLREQQANSDMKKSKVAPYANNVQQAKGGLFAQQAPLQQQIVPQATGFNASNNATGLFGQQQQQQQQQQQAPPPPPTGFGGGFGQPNTVGFGGTLFGNATPSNAPSPFGVPRPGGGGLFGAQSAVPAPSAAPVARSGGLFGSTAAADVESDLVAGAPALDRGERLDALVEGSATLGGAGGGGGADLDGAPGVADDDVSTLMGERQPMAVAESTSETHGMTTTYDVPGVRSIPSSALTRRHLISTIDLAVVEFTCVVVPKLKPVAFLKARIRNPSKITLLRGSASLTLDGSFLGTTQVPKVFPDQFFSLSLGADPGITCTYAKPTRKTSSQGVFNKEETTLYTRSIFLHNAKSTSASLQVHDQVPTSENEKLRINIITPKNLKAEGDSVKVPTSSVLVGKKDADGDAASMVSSSTPRSSNRSSIVGSLTGRNEEGISVTASMKKAGEVQWDVKLEKGKMCRLPLEYEVKIPSGETIYAAN